MIHRRRILAALAIMTLPVVAHGQRVPPGPPPPTPSRPPMSLPPNERHPSPPGGGPRDGTGRAVAGAGMVIVGFGSRPHGDGDGGSKSRRAARARPASHARSTARSHPWCGSPPTGEHSSPRADVQGLRPIDGDRVAGELSPAFDSENRLFGLPPLR